MVFGSIKRLMAVRSLFERTRIVNNFSNMHLHFSNVEIASRATPDGIQGDVSLRGLGAMDWRAHDGSSLDQWLATRRCTALVVLRQGSVVHERYNEGTSKDDQRISWSVTKSVLSLLIGIALERGDIQSLDDPAEKYVAMLRKSAYADVTIANLLMMASGVEFDEDYARFFSDINRMARLVALGGSLDRYAASRKHRFAEQGAIRKYNSLDTHVLGMILRGATGTDLQTLLRRDLFDPIGVESSVRLLVDGRGAPFILGGLMMTTRDLARVGQLCANRGAWQGRQVVPEQWMDRSSRNIAPMNFAPTCLGYGFHWWVPPDPDEGEFFAHGIYGQYLYINMRRQMVIALNAADAGFAAIENNPLLTNLSFFRALAADPVFIEDHERAN